MRRRIVSSGLLCGFKAFFKACSICREQVFLIVVTHDYRSKPEVFVPRTSLSGQSENECKASRWPCIAAEINQISPPLFAKIGRPHLREMGGMTSCSISFITGERLLVGIAHDDVTSRPLYAFEGFNSCAAFWGESPYGPAFVDKTPFYDFRIF